MFVVYLSIGIVSTSGEEDNLMQVLHSLTSYIPATEYSDIVIVVVFDGDSNADVLQRIKGDFQNELDNGLIQVIYPTGDFLREVHRKPLGRGSLMTFTDNFKKMTTDFNMRLIFLFEYCYRISKNYLQLTDQARAIKPYFPVIKQVIDNFEEQNISFYAHDFGVNLLPALGRLYSAEMLGDLVEYAALFPGSLMPHEIIDIHASLRRVTIIGHQEPGDFLFNMANERRGAKPEVEFKTTGTFEGGHGLEKAFNEKEGFAWLQTPKGNDSLVMEFKEPIQISRVLIITGSPLWRDMLTSGVLMACGINTETNSCDESQCTEVGQFRDPLLDATNLENVVSFPIKCLKINVDAKHWVMIREISIWPKEHKG